MRLMRTVVLHEMCVVVVVVIVVSVVPMAVYIFCSERAITNTDNISMSVWFCCCFLLAIT